LFAAVAQDDIPTAMAVATILSTRVSARGPGDQKIDSILGQAVVPGGVLGGAPVVLVIPKAALHHLNVSGRTK